MPPSFEIEVALRLSADQRGSALLRVGESQWFDRKSIRIHPPTLAETLVAFANAEGGTVIVGLSGGRVEGVDGSRKRVNDLRQATVDHAVPPVRVSTSEVACVNEAGVRDHLLVMTVAPSEAVHATNRDEVFLRVGDENRRLSFFQRQELVYDKGQSHFDGTPVRDVTTADLETNLVGDYVAAIGHRDQRRALGARSLLTRTGDVTVAAYLLFAPLPQDVFPAAHARVLRYQGTSRGVGRDQRLLEDIRIQGPIPAVIRGTAEAVRTLQPSRRVLGSEGVFVRQGIIPEDAWLEGIVNAIVHRSYSIGGNHVRADIFDDRIEIDSPGRFPGLVNVEDPRGVVRFARNPRIARVCADLDFGQELGEGIRRMFEEMRIRGLATPLYRQSEGSVRLTLSAVMLDPRLAATLPGGYPAIIDAIREAGNLSTGDLSTALKRARPTMLRQLHALRKAGLIDWIGKSPKDPRAFWRVHSE